MNKREIFKRLQNIRDYARVTDTWPHDNAEQQNLHLRNAVEAIAKDLGELLLDLSDSTNYENEKLMEIYKAWEKWDNEPCSSGQRVLAELKDDIMEVVHNVMEGIKKEKKDA